MWQVRKVWQRGRGRGLEKTRAGGGAGTKHTHTRAWATFIYFHFGIEARGRVAGIAALMSHYWGLGALCRGAYAGCVSLRRRWRLLVCAPSARP